MDKSLSDKIEKMTKERVSSFKKKVLPQLQGLIDTRNKALEGAQKADRLSQIDEEIKDLNIKIDSHRKSAAESENHDSSVAEIVKMRLHIETLKEVREEIENKILPIAKKQLYDANNALANAFEDIMREMALEEKAQIEEQYDNLVVSILSHHDGVVTFGRTALEIPLQQNPEVYSELLIWTPGIEIALPTAPTFLRR